jgi:hypothetical protein
MTRRGVILLALLVIVATVFIVRDAMEGIAEKHRRACVENLRDIEGAKEQFAFDHEGAAPADFNALMPNYLDRMPVCPSGGAYDLGDLQTQVQCSAEGHGL